MKKTSDSLSRVSAGVCGAAFDTFYTSSKKDSD